MDLRREKRRNPIAVAVKRAGGPSNFARTMGVSLQVANKWREQGYLPADRAPEIELLFGIRREELVLPDMGNSHYIDCGELMP